jgi:ABC-type amino acid transport substrate-binding protein
MTISSFKCPYLLVFGLIAWLLPCLCSAQDKQPLRVAVYTEAPFGYRDTQGEFQGLMVEVWRDIAAELGLDYELVATDMQGLMNGLAEHRYDVGLGAITITPQREAIVDFSQPVNPSGTGIAIAKNNVSAVFKTFAGPIALAILKLAAGLIGLLLISGVLVWFVERRHERDPGHRDIDTIEDGLWWSAVTISTIGYGDKVPRTRLGRVFGILWIFASLVMLSLFTANASAIFTVAKIESHIETVEDLRKVRVAAAANSSGEEYLLREQVRYRQYGDIREALDALVSEEVDAVVSNVPVVQYLNNTVYKHQINIAPQYLLKNNMGIALAPGSDLREPINQVLLALIAEPKWQAAVNRYLGD